jgi:hypothetical protein
VYIKIDNERISFSYDKNFTKYFLILYSHDVICVNKRSVFKSDINTFSIHYKNPNLINAVKEIKLKADSRKEASDWIELLRVKLSLNKKFEFQLRKSKEKRIETFLKNLINFNPKNFFFVVNNMDQYLMKRIKFYFLRNLENIIVIKDIQDSTSNLERSLNGMSCDQPLIRNNVNDISDVEINKKYETKQQLPILNQLTNNIKKNSIINVSFILIVLD